MNLGASATVGAGNYPAKFSFDVTTASCASDYVVFNTSQTPANPPPLAQASIVAFNNLYSGCGPTFPEIDWAYNTSNSSSPSLSGNIQTSIVLSGDGTQVAFIDTGASTSSLVILKVNPGDGSTYNASSTGAATVLNISSTGANYKTCKQNNPNSACMVGLAFSNGANDTSSAVFYDYSDDVLYVGDDMGNLHKFTGIFNGAPAEQVGNGFPISLNASADNVGSPVYDSITSGAVFVGDAAGYLYEVTCNVACSAAGQTSATLHTSNQIGTGAQGISDGVIVDVTADEVYAVVSKDMSQKAGVFQFSYSGTPISGGGTEAQVSNTNSTLPTLYAGDFDNVYYSSDSGSSGANRPTGKLYVCGSTGTGTTVSANLYQIPITNSAMGTPVALAAMTTASGPAAAQCSPVTEFYNANASPGAEDMIFFSVQTNTVQNESGGSACTGNASSGCLSNPCTGMGCLMSLPVSQWQANTSYAVGQHIIDSSQNIELVSAITSGTSGSSAPSWNAVGQNTADYGVTWLNQGPAGTYTGWTQNHAYAAGSVILDGKGYIQEVTTAGTSGGSQPNWTEATENTTTDNSAQWTNLGPAGALGFLATGGSSGVVVDNESIAISGASNIYFSNIGSAYCARNGTGGCAIQVSQNMLGAASNSYDGTYNGYSHYRTITFDHTMDGSSNSSNFPALISGTYSYLATAANGGEVQNTSASDDGIPGDLIPDDLIFTSDPGCSSLLNWEIESYNASTGAINAWVKVPTLSASTNTVIYMCYDNSSISSFQGGATGAAWDSNYKGIWHFPNGTTLGANDSTSNGNNGTVSNAIAVTSEIDGGANFNGTNAEVTTSYTQNSATAYSIEAWMNTASTNVSVAVQDRGSGAGRSLTLGLDGAGGCGGGGCGSSSPTGKPLFGDDSNDIFIGVEGTSALNGNTWHYLVGTWSASSGTSIATSQFTLYIDGAKVGSPSAITIGSDTSPLTGLGGTVFGYHQAWNSYYDGVLDEVRISTIVRSEDWITASYNNQVSTSTFYTVGAQN